MIDLEKLKEFLEYNPDTGIVSWRKDKGRAKKGSQFGCIAVDGYRKGAFCARPMKHSRIAWALYYKEQPPEFIDHINGDKADDRISNLRAVTKRQNNRNVLARKNNATRTLGVHFHKRLKKYQVSIKDNFGKQLHLGYYEDLELAELVRKEAERIYYGEYARSSA